MATDQVLAIDIGGTKLASAIVTPFGELLAHEQIDTRAADGAERVLARALDLAATVAAKRADGAPGLKAVGLSTNGLTSEDGVTLAPAVPGWSDLRIPTALRDAFPGLPSAILNDVKAAALAELRWGAMRGRTTALYVNLGTGFAAGIVTGGELQPGAHGAAGEIGYIAPTLESVATRRPDEALLEERIGGRGVATWASVELGHPVTMAALMAAPEHTPEAELRERLLREIGFWVANVTVMLDPEVVVVGGGIMRAASDLCRRLELAIAGTGPFPVEVVPARFGPESSLLGAGAIALDAAGLPRPT